MVVVLLSIKKGNAPEQKRRNTEHSLHVTEERKTGGTTPMTTKHGRHNMRELTSYGCEQNMAKQPRNTQRIEVSYLTRSSTIDALGGFVIEACSNY